MHETPQVIPRIRSGKLAMLGYIVCGLGGLASLVMGYIKSLRNGLDFQWPGSHFILRGIDPWRAYLAGSKQILSQSPPNYAHELYILLLPLGAMPYAFASRAWYALNVILSVAVVWLVGQIYEMDRARRLLLLLLLWGSLPFRNGLYAGQQAVLELVFFSMVFYLPGNLGRGIALGLSIAKYSFAPVLVPVLFFRRKFKLLEWSLIPPAVGLLAVWGFVHGSFTRLAIEPLLVSRIGVCPGAGDIMTLIEHILGSRSPIATLIPVSLAILYAWNISHDKDRSLTGDMACISVGSLLLIKHLIYDYVFLIAPLAYAFQKMRGPMRWAIFGIVGFFWYVETLGGLSARTQDSFPLQLASAALLVGLLCTLELDIRAAVCDNSLLRSGGSIDVIQAHIQQPTASDNPYLDLK